MAPYKSVWSIIERWAREKARSDDKYDELFMLITGRVMDALVTPIVWDCLRSDDEKQSWAEYHVWKYSRKKTHL